MIFSIKKGLSILFTFFFFSSICFAEDKAIIVFDASGSMWGQVEGKNKISIAKKTLINLVDNWDDASELGLLAYGHRRKGDCSDIQTLVPVGKVNKSQMISSVKNINPKGKTPISASIKMAADELKFTEDNATVILISDGKETCKADPCKTATDLEKLGVNFTAHVIGFDVDIETSKQLQCIADNTGGKYFSADNAQELNEALEKVVEKPKSITIQAMDKENGGKLKKFIEWKLINQETEEVISVSGNGSGKNIVIAGDEATENTISKGKWTINGTSGMYSGETSVEITGSEDQLIKVDMLELLPKVTLNAPAEATTGTEMLISWDSPDVDKARITLQEADEKPNYHSNPALYTENYNKGTNNSGEASLRLPSKEGDYILRFYNLKNSKMILADHKIRLKPAEIIITADDEAVTGTELELSWVAPKESKAKLVLQFADDKPNYYKHPSIFTEKKKQGSIRLPSETGEYVLRWFNMSDKKVMAERPIKLVKAEISIVAPDEVVTGTEIELSWVAPKDAIARLVLQMADEKPKYHSNPSVFTENKKQAMMRLPSEAGDYVLRWFNSSDKKLVVERPIKLSEAQISIIAPDEAGAGTEIDVSWEAPKTANARINLELVEDKPKYHSNPALYTTGNKKTLRLPSVAGDYIFRWYNTSDKKLITERPIKVTEQKITITAEDQVIAGKEVEISWDAPKGLNSFITIQLADEKPNYNARPYLYTKKDKSGYMRTPSIAGDYILRWFNQGDRKNILAERPITLTAPEIKISAPDEGIAGTEIELSWVAPKGLESFINVQLADEKPNYNAKPYLYTRKKTSDYLRLPSTTGDYKLRWYNQGHRKPITERALKIIDPNIVITVPDEAKAGTELEISWQAPKDLDSFINFQKEGEKPNYNAKTYLYTKKKSSDYMFIPEDAKGVYILRWYNRHDRKLVTEKKIKIISQE